ncbi:MAG TPA: class I SAM-dependent methyltransferase [Verrucomicrobiae bacterium]|nr:class I SAM-dependent methyltransferase [Verrucomicrobiae bacterium]
MTEERSQTIETYRTKAGEFAEYFSLFPHRAQEVARGFSFLAKKNPKTVELGVGTGGDTGEILQHTDDYVGVDFVTELLAYAREKHPGTRFVEADITEWEIPQGTEMVFGFATLLHLNQEEVADLFRRMHSRLAPGAVIYLSLKYGRYRGFMKNDRFGVREFYLYTPHLLKKLIGARYSIFYAGRLDKSTDPWIMVGIRKKNVK